MGWRAGQVSMVSNSGSQTEVNVKLVEFGLSQVSLRGRVGDKGHRVKEPAVCETLLLKVIRNFTFSLSKLEIISFMLY